MYNAALKRKWGNAAVLDYAVRTAREEGINEGIEKGIKEERAKAEAEKLEEKRKNSTFPAWYGHAISGYCHCSRAFV